MTWNRWHLFIEKGCRILNIQIFFRYVSPLLLSSVSGRAVWTSASARVWLSLCLQSRSEPHLQTGRSREYEGCTGEEMKGLWHCIRDFSSMCTYHVPEEEAANYPYISYWEKVLSLLCFSEPHMHGVKWWQVLLQVFQVQYVHFQPFAGQHYTGNVQGDWQHLNANAKCHKCQIDLMLWLIEWAWLWTVWVWLHK